MRCIESQLAGHQFPWGCKLYPSGEFVLYRKRKTDVKADIKETFSSIGKAAFKGGSESQMWGMQESGLAEQWYRVAGEVDLPRVQGLAGGATNAGGRAMGLSALVNSEKRRRGLGGLTTHGKNLVREAAYGLQERYGKEYLSFWTCTLPRMTDADMRSVCKGWARIVENVKKKLVYHLGKKQLPTHVVGVTELQPDRWAAEKYPGWHLHIVFVGRKRGRDWAISTELGDKLWSEAVSEYTESEYSFHASCKLEPIHTSASGYLAKYMSKGSAVIGEVEESYPGCTPSAWYFVTKSLRTWVVRCTRTSSGVARSLHQLLLHQIKSVIAPWCYSLPTRDGLLVAVCWLGRIAAPPPLLARLD